jgi:hypothetical protein
MAEKSDWKTLTYVIGGSIGLLTGLTAAYLIIRQREESGTSLKLSTSEGARIGMGIFSFLKSVAETGKK